MTTLTFPTQPETADATTLAIVAFFAVKLATERLMASMLAALFTPVAPVPACEYMFRVNQKVGIEMVVGAAGTTSRRIDEGTVVKRFRERGVNKYVVSERGARFPFTYPERRLRRWEERPPAEVANEGLRAAV